MQYKRSIKKVKRTIIQWIIFEDIRGKYHSIGVNRLGKVPSNGRPLVPPGNTIEEELNTFPFKIQIPFIKLSQEEDDLVFMGNMDIAGMFGEKILLKKLEDEEFTWIGKGKRKLLYSKWGKHDNKTNQPR
jgi:hypothetical protein